MSNKELNKQNDALETLFQGVGDQMLPPPELEQAVIAGVPYRGKIAAGVHVRKFTGAIVTYAVGIMLFLGAILLLPRLFNQYEPVGTNAENTTTADTREQLCPQKPPFANGLTFKGDEYTDEDRIVSVAYFEGGWGEYTRRSIKADLMDSTDVDVMLFVRDQRMKEVLGLEIEHRIYAPTHDGNIGGFPGAQYYTLDSVISTICSDSSEWDIISSTPNFARVLTKAGAMTNLADLEAWNVDYLDLNASYWGKTYNDAMSYQGYYFWITGDISLRYVGGMYATFVNQEYYQENLLEQYGSIYDIVKEGNWTLDLMTEMATMSYTKTPDTFGFVYEPSEMLSAMAMGAGTGFAVKKAETGEVSLAIMDSRTVDSAKKLLSLTDNNPGAKKYAFDYTDASIQAFANGDALFAVNTLISADIYLSQMQDEYYVEYYVIPLPKYDAKEDYRTIISDTTNIFAIPLSSKKIPQATAALEWLCQYSALDVTPLFFEKILKGQYTRDPEAAVMMDLIYQNVYGDFGQIWSEHFDNIDQVFHDCKNVNLSKLKMNYTNWNLQMFEFIDDIENAIQSNQFRKEKLTS